MLTRLAQRKRPRRPAVLFFGAPLLVALLFAAAAFAAIPPPPADTGCAGGPFPNSVEVTTNEDSADCTTGDGALVSYIGSNDTDRQASGTGLFDPFVRLQADGDEEGFNTNAAVTLDAKSGPWTKAILVSAIPIVNIGGTNYWELFVDINDKNSSKPISLNKVEIYFAPGPGGANITGYSGFAGFSATLVYAFDGEIKINDVNSGSGRGDLRYLVPLTNIPTPPAGTFFVLYSKWGTTSGYPSDGGFEEWKVRKAPSVIITKTADAAAVSAGQQIGFIVTVTNNGAADATGVTIADTLPGGSGIDWSEDSASCSISGSPGAPPEILNCGPVTLAANGGSLSVHLTSPTTAASCGTYNNTANFTSTNAGSGSDTDSTAVQCGALVIHKNTTKGTDQRVSAAGAVFGVDSADAGTLPDFSVTDDVTAAAPDEDADTGEVCVTGLAPGAYTVTETSPPDGYGAGSPAAGQSVTVVSGTTCATAAAGATATFTNPPLGEIGVTFTDLGSGETNASIVCTGLTPVSENGGADSSTITANSAANPTVVTTSADHGLTSGATVQITGSNSTPSIDGTWTVTFLTTTTFSIPVEVTGAGTTGTVSAMDDTDETYTDLAPGTYNCQIVIDP